MRLPDLLPSLVVWFFLGPVLGARAGQVDASPVLERLTQGYSARDEDAAAPASGGSLRHEALVAPGGDRDRNPEHVEYAPPSMIVERPGSEAPTSDSQWIEGYWAWNESRSGFDWVTGTWRVPPPGKFWVNGYWRHDAAGWTRVPGFWSKGRLAPAGRRAATATAPDQIRTGPPSERPKEAVGPAPGLGFFYIAGEYVPQGSKVVWKPGFWYPSQPGWEWMPAHWVRHASGWVFREGYWNQLGRTPGPLPSDRSFSGGATIVSASADRGRLTGDMKANSLAPAGTVTSSGDVPSQTSGAGTELAGATDRPDAAGDGEVDPAADTADDLKEKPSESAADSPVRVSSAPRPTYYYPNYNPWGGGYRWDGRSLMGAARQFLPF